MSIKYTYAVHYVYDYEGDNMPWKVCFGKSTQDMQRISCHVTEKEAMGEIANRLQWAIDEGRTPESMLNSEHYETKSA